MTPLRRHLAVVAIFVAIIAVVYMAWQPSSAPAPVAVPVSWGTLEADWQGGAIAVRRETVQISPVSGVFVPLAEQGRGVRVGAAVAAVSVPGGKVTDLAASQSGTVDYNLDSLEPDLAPAALPWLTGAAGRVAEGPDAAWAARFLASAAVGTAETAETSDAIVAAGDPVFKLVDSSRLWLIVVLPAMQAVAWQPGHAVSLELAGHDVPFVVTYMSAARGGDILVGLTARGPFPAAALFNRVLPVRTIFGRYTGWLLPAAAVRLIDGQTVVRVENPKRAGAQPGSEVTVPVHIEGQVGDRVAVSGNLQADMSVILP